MRRNQYLCGKYMKYGLSVFEDIEVIELLLALNPDGKNHRQEAEKLNDKYDSLCELIDDSFNGKGSISDIPEHYLFGLKLPHEIANRYLFEKVKEKPFINCSEDVLRYLQHSMKGLKVEYFKVLYLNVRNMILAEEDISKGTLTSSAIYPREVIKSALKYNASALVFAHNHPSGNLNPSQDDLRITKRLVDAAKLLDISVHDHIIIGNGGYYSFADSGYL